MRNTALPQDYLRRCRYRLAAIETLYKLGAYADVVRESQEVLELALKALLRSSGFDPPHSHEVSGALIREAAAFPSILAPDIPRFADISRSMERDRSLAYYGNDSVTPSDFYRVEDANRARRDVTWVVERVELGIARPKEIAPERARRPGPSKNRGPSR